MGNEITKDGILFVADSGNERVQYFTLTGSFLGKFGKPGSGNGEFKGPIYAALSPSDLCVYADDYNHRIQYFEQTNPAVVPESLGKVKALFR